MHKLVKSKVMAVVLALSMFLGQFAGMVGLQAASASNSDIQTFLFKSFVELEKPQILTMFDLSSEIIGTDGALTAAQLNQMQSTNVSKEKMIAVLVDIKQKLSVGILQKKDSPGFVSLSDLEQAKTDIQASTDKVTLDTTMDIFWQVLQTFARVPQSEMTTLFGSDITAAMQIATLRGLDISTTKKILETLTTSEKASLKEIIIATGAYAAEVTTPSGGGGGGGGGGGVTPTTTTTTTTTTATQFSKDDVDKQLASNATGITIPVKDVVEINSDALTAIGSSKKDIIVKNDVEKAALTLPDGSVVLPAGTSLKISLQPVSADVSSKFMLALPTGAKTVSKIYEISAKNVSSGTENKVEFKKPISITLAYDPTVVDPSVADKLGAYWFNPDTNAWVFMNGTVDQTAKTVTFMSDHLSNYALMVYNVTFTDTAGHWAQADIDAMATLHVVKGGPDGLFRPNSNITRAEFSAMLVRLLEIEPQQNAEVTFNDVENNKWYSSVIAAAYSNGLIQGYDANSFGPEDNITREQLATMVSRAYVYLDGTMPDSSLAESKLDVFNDRTDISAWAVNATAMAVDQKIITGYPDGQFKSKATASRAEALVMLKRLLNVMKK